MDKKSQQFLLSLARQTITDYFTVGNKLKIKESDLPSSALAKKAATFVTLTKQSDLRGCIGNLLPKRKMYEDVINNSLLAAFGDPRFAPLQKEELKEIKIEISILSPATAIKFDSADDLLAKIKPDEHGIILQKGFSQATFLPQVWQDLPDKEKFLSALCQKAGLSENAWREEDCELFYYTVENFSEDE